MTRPKKYNPALKAVYKQEYPWCELLGYLQGEVWEKILKEWLVFFGVKYPEDMPQLELHHIFQGKDRWDLWGNMIHLSPAAHAYAHKYPQEQKVACMYAKSIKGDLNKKTLKEMRDIFLFCPIGKMESWTLTEKWAIDMRNELIERHGT